MELKLLNKMTKDLDRLRLKAMQERAPLRRKLKKRIKRGAAAGAVTAGVVLSGLFGSPAELTDSSKAHLTQPPPIVQMVDMDVEEEEEKVYEIEEETQEKKGLSDRVKEWILGLPVVVRALVGVPLWAVGWGLTSLLGLAWQSAGGVVLPIIIKFVVLLAVIFLVVFLTAKALHPDMPAKEILKKMFRKKNKWFLLIGAVVLTALDTVFLLVLEDYEIWRRVIIFVVGLGLLFLLLRPFIAKAIRKRRKEKGKYSEAV